MDEKLIINCCNSSLSMAEAARKAGIPHMTFKRYALQLGIYKPNMSGKGTLKPKKSGIIPLEDILLGKYPNYKSGGLRKRLIEEGKKDHKCEKCKLSEWLNKPIPLELHHKDGNKHNHLWENLELLCPNCHTLTPTYKGKNMKTRCGAVG